MNDETTKWPTFLGIGVPKAGTTWLYELLRSHSQVWVPPDQREIHFFNREYHRGLGWYEQFFPSYKDTSYEAVGEVSPHYFFCGSERIEALSSGLSSISRFILMLRDPVDRLYSHYWYRRRLDNFDYSFWTFTQKHPNVVEWSRYAEHLTRWLKCFDRDQFLVLTVEKDLKNVETTREQVAQFLGVSAEGFPKGAGKSKKNSRHLPRFQTLYAWASWVHRGLLYADVRWPAKIARRLGVKSLFGRKEVDKSMDPSLRQELSEHYADEVKRLEQILGRTFSEWENY